MYVKFDAQFDTYPLMSLLLNKPARRPVASGKVLVIKEHFNQGKTAARNTSARKLGEGHFVNYVDSHVGLTEFPLLVEARADAESAVSSAGIAQDQESNVIPSMTSHQAASIIQNAYRRSISRPRRVIQPGLPTARARLFLSFLEEARGIKWPVAPIHRIVFLGLLPHLLLCLEEVQKYLLSAKNETKKLLAVAEHLELEMLGKRQTDIV
jgi:hypothetical protein